MCTRLCVAICFYVLSKYLEAELLNCMVSVYLSSWGTTKLFSKEVFEFTFPQKIHRNFSCSPFHQNLLLPALLIVAIRLGTQVQYRVIILIWLMIVNIFSCFLVICIYCLMKCLIESFAHLKNWVAYLLLCAEFVDTFWL